MRRKVWDTGGPMKGIGPYGSHNEENHRRKRKMENNLFTVKTAIVAGFTAMGALLGW